MSLKIESEANTLILTGRLDTFTAPELEAKLEQILPNAKTLVLDLEKLKYISSAGLRIVLKIQKRLPAKGCFRLIHVQDAVREVLDMTGFTDFLTIE